MQSTGSPWTGAFAGLVLLSAFSAHAAEFSIGEHTFTLPDGFTIERIAGPPLIDRPIVADFDEQGRLYVADSSGSNDKVEKQLAEKPHRIVRLEDSDGDGKFDRSVVFADRMMFPEGAMWLDGSLYVAAPPSIWKLTDTDGDGAADQRLEWFKGGTLTGCANDLHGPYRGPDGWIYWCKGAFAEQTHERPGRTPIKDRASHIFRCRPDGSGFESVMSGGMDNPVEIAFTATGEPIFTSTFIDLSGSGKRDGLGHAVFGGVFPKVNEVTEGVQRTGPLLPVMTHFGPGAPSGLCRYQSGVLGSDFRDNLFATLFNLHKVTRHILEPSGATFRTRDSDFVVSSNTDFHPTDVLEDADGSLLIIDTGGWYKLCCPTSQLAKPDVLGTIYRVRKVGAPVIDDPRGQKVDWSKLQPAELSRCLSDARPAVAQRAVDRLVQIGSEAIPALRDFLQTRKETAALQHALWALSRIGTPAASDVIQSAFHHADSAVQQSAMRAFAATGERGNEHANKLLAGLVNHDGGETTSHLRRTAAESLARIRDPRTVPALLNAAAKAEGDPFLEHAITYALIEIGDANASTAGLSANHPSVVRRAALIALNEMYGRPLPFIPLLEFLDAPDEKLRDTALWVLSRRLDASATFTAVLSTLLSDPDLSGRSAEQVETIIIRAVQLTDVQRLGSEILKGGGTTARKVMLRAMAQIRPKDVPQDWISNLASLMDKAPKELLGDIISAARALASKKEHEPQIVRELLRLTKREDLPAETRLDALGSIPTPELSREEVLFKFVQKQLEEAPTVPARVLAGSILSRAKLSASQRETLIDALPRVGSAELTKLLPAFATSVSEPLARRLITTLEKAPAVNNVAPQAIRAVVTKLPEAVQADGDRLLARLQVDTAQQRARLEALSAELPKGDVRRGQAVFNSAKATCSACHAMGSLGGKLGPDLTSIGTVRSERDLLEAIVFPSASFVRSYEPATVRLKSGEEITGILKGEGTDAVTLAVGAGSEQRFPRNEVADVQPGTISLMPQGYDQILSRQELADLLAFLKATRSGPQ